MSKTGDTRRYCEVELTVCNNLLQPPKNEMYTGRGLQKIVECCQLYLAVPSCVTWCHPYILLHFYTCLTAFFLHCPGPCSNLLIAYRPCPRIRMQALPERIYIHIILYLFVCITGSSCSLFIRVHTITGSGCSIPLFTINMIMGSNCSNLSLSNKGP